VARLYAWWRDGRPAVPAGPVVGGLHLGTYACPRQYAASCCSRLPRHRVRLVGRVCAAPVRHLGPGPDRGKPCAVDVQRLFPFGHRLHAAAPQSGDGDHRRVHTLRYGRGLLSAFPPGIRRLLVRRPDATVYAFATFRSPDPVRARS
jgi:hypothetical protein